MKPGFHTPKACQRTIKPILSVAILVCGTLNFAQGQQQDYYDPEDWEAIPTLGAITSVTEIQEGLYFSSLGGLYFYDRFAQVLEPALKESYGLPDRHVYQVLVDPFTRIMWVATETSIAYRLWSDPRWIRVEPPDHYRGRDSYRLGASVSGVWLDMGGVYILYHPLSGINLRRQLTEPAEDVEWNTSAAMFRIAPDLSGYTTTGDWLPGIDEFAGPGFMRAYPTLKYVDQENGIWFGSNLGLIFQGEHRSSQLTPLSAGIARPVVTVFSSGGNRVWFGDNPFRRSGYEEEVRGGYFLSSWDEETGNWQHYHDQFDQRIRSNRINVLQRFKDQTWMGTMQGVQILNSRRNRWQWIGRSAGLPDDAVWDLEPFGKYVVAATRWGVGWIEKKSGRLVKNDSLMTLPNFAVYDLYAKDKQLYAGTQHGVYVFKHKTDGGNGYWTKIFEFPAKGIGATDNHIYLGFNDQLYQGTENGGFVSMAFPIALDAKILEIRAYGPYIWLATTAGAWLFHDGTGRKILFDQKSGLPGNWVYSVWPDEEWVWFLTDGGVVRFRWGAYYQ